MGLFNNIVDRNPYNYNIDDYKQVSNSEKLRGHREFLQSIENKEDSRLDLLENKTSQLVTQTGIIISLLSLFVPIFMGKIFDQNIFFRIAVFVMFALAIWLYVLTIHRATKNYDVEKYVYSRPSPENVLKYQDKPLDDFTAIEIKDLLWSINQNEKTNNKKADNLIYSNRTFKLANFTTALLIIVFLCSTLLFTDQREGAATRKNIVLSKTSEPSNTEMSVLKEQDKRSGKDEHSMITNAPSIEVPNKIK